MSWQWRLKHRVSCLSRNTVQCCQDRCVCVCVTVSHFLTHTHKGRERAVVEQLAGTSSVLSFHVRCDRIRSWWIWNIYFSLAACPAVQRKLDESWLSPEVVSVTLSSALWNYPTVLGWKLRNPLTSSVPRLLPCVFNGSFSCSCSIWLITESLQFRITIDCIALARN